MSAETAVVLILWGMLVGLDLTSVPQIMIARPLVAGAIAGAILGDINAGLRIGILFELFQYDVLPLGAARYPEYGPATVAGVVAARLVGGILGVGLGAVVGLFTGLLGGLSMTLIRRLNTRAVQRKSQALERGERAVLLRLHWSCIVSDAIRAAGVTAVGLALAVGAAALPVDTFHPRGALIVAAAATGAAVAAGASGTVRLVRGANLGWFAAGVLGAGAVLWLR
jgi:PTS system mannose-specific IIC component